MKHVLVTGGAKGIGRAIVEELAVDFKVTATYHGSQAAADELTARYPNVRFVRIDLEDREALENFITDLNQGEPIDVLINNAGIYIGKPFEKMTATELYQQIDLNLTAVARLTQGLVSTLKKSKSPLVINISSQAVNARIAGEALYTAVKAAVTNLSYVLRSELNSEGIRITTVEPFGVNTYGMAEPSSMILPQELARTIRYIVELPPHLQIDTLGMSHIDQPRSDYPEWIER